MPNTIIEGERIYNRAFYDGQSAVVLHLHTDCADYKDLFEPRAVADVGRGVGTRIQVFKEHGVEIIHGYDGEYVNRADLRIDPELFHPIELRKN